MKLNLTLLSSLSITVLFWLPSKSENNYTLSSGGLFIYLFIFYFFFYWQQINNINTQHKLKE